MQVALTPAHYLANILDPCHRGSALTDKQTDTAMQFCAEEYPEALSSVLKFKAKAAPFQPYMFTPALLKDLTPLSWWQSQADRLDDSINRLAEQLFTARASSAGMRGFS